MQAIQHEQDQKQTQHDENYSQKGRQKAPRLGEKTHAFIVAAGEIDLDALRDHCRKELSDYKVPDGMTVVDGDDLPRNAAGKVVKHALRQMLMAEART